MIYCLIYVDTTLTKVKFGIVTVEPLGNIFAFMTGESNSTLWIGNIDPVYFILSVLIGGEPPYDGYPERKIDQTHIALVIVYNVAAVVGLVFVIVCFVFNVVFRKRK